MLEKVPNQNRLKTWSNSLSITNTTFIVQRGTTSSNYADIATLDNSLSYLDSSVGPGTTNYYRIRAVSYGGQYTNSTEVSVTTPTTGTSIPMGALTAWYKADCGNAPGVVNCWVDQTTNVNSAYYRFDPNNNSAPIWGSTNLNGFPAISFIGTNDFQVPTFAASWSQGEAFVVLQSFGQTNTNWVSLWLMGAGSSSRYPYTNNYVQDDFGLSGTETALFSPGLASLATPQLYDPMSQPGLWAAWVNNNPRSA